MSEETKPEEPKVVKTKPLEVDAKEVEEVKDRLKFFFSDANVRQDFFIRKLLTKEGGSNPRTVPIEALLRFNTIKRHTTNPAVVIQAAKALSEILTLDEEETAIGRVAPFTQALMDDNIPKTLFVKNLPLKSNGEDSPRQYAVTQDDIRELFAKYGKVSLIKMKWSSTAEGKGDEDLIGHKYKKAKKKYPVGCAMVEFETKEALEKAAEVTLTTKSGEKVEAKEKLVIGEDKAEVEVMLLSEYIETRKKEKTGDENGGSRKRDRDNNKEENEAERETPTFTVDWKPGCVIRLKGLPETCDREAILEAIASALDISVTEVRARRIYADYSRGQTDGAIRFPEVADHIADVAKRVNDGDVQVGGEKISEATLLEGDEEKKYWEDFMEFKNKQIRHREEERREHKKHKGQHKGRGKRSH
jgi:RNA recognition motif-containing protein